MYLQRLQIQRCCCMANEIFLNTRSFNVDTANDNVIKVLRCIGSVLFSCIFICLLCDTCHKVRIYFRIYFKNKLRILTEIISSVEIIYNFKVISFCTKKTIHRVKKHHKLNSKINSKFWSVLWMFSWEFFELLCHFTCKIYCHKYLTE